MPGAGGFPLVFLNMFIVFPHPLAFVSRVSATVVPGLCSGKKMRSGFEGFRGAQGVLKSAQKEPSAF